jgi:hypothetical protein
MLSNEIREETNNPLLAVWEPVTLIKCKYSMKKFKQSRGGRPMDAFGGIPNNGDHFEE